MQPTKAQKRALLKLTDEWQSAYELQETIPTLEGLVRRKLAEKKLETGYLFMPHNSIMFRLTVKLPKKGI